MYSPIGTCSGPPRPTDFTSGADTTVLVCKAHYGRLRKLDSRTAADLERQLRKAFGLSDRDQEHGLVYPMSWGRG